MDSVVFDILVKAYDDMNKMPVDKRIAHLIYLIMNSPQYSVQK